MTSCHPDASANAPCTSTMVGLAAAPAARGVDVRADSEAGCCAAEVTAPASIARSTAAPALVTFIVYRPRQMVWASDWIRVDGAACGLRGGARTIRAPPRRFA